MAYGHGHVTGHKQERRHRVSTPEQRAQYVAESIYALDLPWLGQEWSDHPVWERYGLTHNPDQQARVRHALQLLLGRENA